MLDFHLKAGYSINASEMGLGKTFISLAVPKLHGGRTLVFAPAFLEKNWKSESEKMGVDITFASYSSLNKNKQYLSENCDKFSFIIADECHYLKNPNAKRTKQFFEIMKHHYPRYFIGLTGTPIKNRVPDLYVLLRLCSMCPEDTNGIRVINTSRTEYTGWVKFANRYCNKMIVNTPRGIIHKYTSVKENKVKELRRILEGKLIRKTSEEVLKDLPELTRIPVKMALRCPPGLKEEFTQYMGGGKIDSKSKAQSALLKAPATVEYVKNILEQGEPVLVFTDHVKSAALLSAGLKAKLITGATPNAERARTVDRFQEGEIDCIVATIGALSVGVTLHKAKHVVFNDISWVPANNDQAEKRIHRIGQKRACFSHYIESSDTDSFIIQTILSKKSSISEVIGK
jgi:SNF2 family DNA or RNA helicase